MFCDVFSSSKVVKRSVGCFTVAQQADTEGSFFSLFFLGHTRQGLKCKLCRMNVHPDCQDQVGKCQPKSRLLRRQRSASEIDASGTASAYGTSPGSRPMGLQDDEDSKSSETGVLMQLI